jgi:hypothetical protein
VAVWAILKSQFFKGKIMALQINISAENNFGQISTLTNCYCKVAKLIGDKSQMHIKVDVMNAEKNRVYREDTFAFTPSVEDGAKNFIAQAYDHLKSLPEFASAIDC